jgi:putative spermidine/putrescine transport system permease protein
MTAADRRAVPGPTGSLDRPRTRVDVVRSLLGAWALMTALFLLAPLVIVFVNSIGEEQYVVFPPGGWSLQWYGRIPGYYLEGAILSVILAVAATATAALVAVPAGLSIARGTLPGRSAIDALLRSPVQIPLLVSGVAFLQFFVLFRTWTGITVTDSFIGLWIAHTIVVSPYLLTAVVARLARYPSSLDEAAYGLGAGPIRTFFDITLPIIGPAVASGVFFAFLVSFDNVPTTIFLIQSGDTTLPLAIFYDTDQDLSRIQYAVGTIVTIVFTTLILVMMRVLNLLPAGDSTRRGGG